MFINQNKIYHKTKTIFNKLNININPHTHINTLSISQIQIIKITKTFSYNTKIIIINKPTSSLTKKKINHLFTIIHKLKKQNYNIIYISHKIKKIFQLYNKITILHNNQ